MLFIFATTGDERAGAALIVSGVLTLFAFLIRSRNGRRTATKASNAGSVTIESVVVSPASRGESTQAPGRPQLLLPPPSSTKGFEHNCGSSKDDVRPVADAVDTSGRVSAAVHLNWFALCIMLMVVSATVGYSLGNARGVRQYKTLAWDEGGDLQRGKPPTYQEISSPRERAEYLARLGHEFYMAEDVDAAIAALEKALAEDQECSLAHYGMGKVLLRARLIPVCQAKVTDNRDYSIDWAQCCDHLSIAMQLDPEAHWACSELAAACECFSAWPNNLHINRPVRVAHDYFRLTPEELKLNAKRLRAKARVLESLATKS